MLEKSFRASRLFKALGNPVRYIIVEELCKNEELTPGQLSELVERPIANVSQHLMHLRSLDIVRFDSKQGNIEYRIKIKGICGLLKRAELCAASIPIK